MVKQYTSLEMRYMANAIRGQYGDDSEFTDAIAMLRQAADLQEREEKREKKYEYARVLSDGSISCTHFDEYAKGYYKFRREVGKWEEVKL